jgi:hypothetical protein
MKTKSLYIPFLLMILLILAGCSGGGGSGTGTAGYGTITMDIADAKPFIEGGEPDELWIVIEEVLVHKSGDGWISMDLIDEPVKINLLAFSNGLKTQLVPPMQITRGHITQIRLVISEAYMVFYGNPDETIEIDVPSGKLRTDKACDWYPDDGGYLRITIHFDLSQSIVQTGVDEYKLKPVFHLFDDDLLDAATICAYIDNISFPDSPDDKLLATVLYDPGPAADDEIPYTKVLITEDTEEDLTYFCIYWIVPLVSTDSGSYILRVSQVSDSNFSDEILVSKSDVGPGHVSDINTDIDPMLVPLPPE